MKEANRQVEHKEITRSNSNVLNVMHNSIVGPIVKPYNTKITSQFFQVSIKSTFEI
jgi:hypothetical protein